MIAGNHLIFNLNLMKWIFILNLKKLKVTISWLKNLLQVMKKYPQVLIPVIGNRNVTIY